MRVTRSPEELPPAERAIAIGTFDGVHRGHQKVVGEARDAGLTTTVVTFDPHPRTALGNRVDLLSTLERRLELLRDLGVDEVLVVDFSFEVAGLEPEEFAERFLRPIGASVIVAGEDFRFGRARRGGMETLRALGFAVRPVELVEGVSSRRIRELVAAGEVRDAAPLLGRPVEIEGIVVSGDARGGTLGFPTANLQVRPDLLVPGFGIYAGSALGHRAAASIGTNPHYGGTERRVEAFLLEFSGDLYGRRMILELWERLRDELAFEDEAALIAQIANDVEAAKAATPPL